MPGDARLSALTVLERCRRNGAFSDDTLSRVIKSDGLDSRDAALCSNICFGTLQNQTLFDYYISAFSSVRPGKLQPKVLDILRISVYQILFLDRVPDRAAVSEAVELCRKNGCSRASGLVNAVLRRISENKSSLPDIPGEGSAEYLSVKYSHPLWLCETLIKEKTYAFAEDFFRCNNSAAPVTAQRNALKCSMDELKSALMMDGAEFFEHPWLDDCLVLSGTGDITGLRAFREGMFYIQDPAARLSVAAAGLMPGMAVLDACAAPGGKSFAACIAMEGRGSITSCDIQEKKLQKIESGAARLGFDGIISAVAMDAKTPYSAMESRYDAVIADVPCSGLGVIRKKPEIRFKRPEEIEALPKIQLAILNGLASCVKPGGVLVYSTCTVLGRENGGTVDAFLAEHHEFEPENFTIKTAQGSYTGDRYTFWPNIDGTDGFFVCRMRKAK